MNTRIKVLSVCGTGTENSYNFAEKIKELLTEQGFDVEMVQTAPGDLTICCHREKFDLISYSCPIPDNCGIPAISGFGLLEGRNVELFTRQALSHLREAGKYPTAC